MRLSEKGCVHLNEWAVHKLPMEAFEFKPEDFQGCVVLTVKEAKGLLEIARDYRMCLFNYWRIPLSLSSNEAFTALRERIKQAEIEHLKHENTQLKKDQARDNLEIERLEESYKNLKYSVLEQAEGNK